jgi:hypothetical protein
MARLREKYEKHGYVVGELTLQGTSNPYSPLKTMYMKRARVTLDQAPEGAGVTTVKLIRNYDVTDVIYETSFASGETTKNLTTEQVLQAGDNMSVVVTSLAGGYAGADLIFSVEYHH